MEAANGVQALEVLKNNKIDFVIMDLDMPEMNGFEALSEIRKTKNETPEICKSTASLITNGDEEFLEFGFDDLSA